MVVVNLNDTLVRKGDHVIVEKQENYTKLKIESLKKNDTEVHEAKQGEIGIKFSGRVKKNSVLYISKA